MSRSLNITSFIVSGNLLNIVRNDCLILYCCQLIAEVGEENGEQEDTRVNQQQLFELQNKVKVLSSF